VHTDASPKGTIIAQRPEPDEPLTDTITVLVSAGPQEVSYSCPDFQSRTLASAKELAAKLGLVVEVKGAGDLVKAQKPKPGTVVKAGETITLELKEVTE
jgi:beta-lactam-binding protein with PASTA domain